MILLSHPAQAKVLSKYIHTQQTVLFDKNKKKDPVSWNEKDFKRFNKAKKNQKMILLSHPAQAKVLSKYIHTQQTVLFDNNKKKPVSWSEKDFKRFNKAKKFFLNPNPYL